MSQVDPEAKDTAVSGRGPHEVPRPSGELVGHTALVGELRARLDRRGGLVTLTGPGGSGKTRLATHLARAWGDAGGHAVWVDLQAARDLTDFDRNVAWALGLAGGPGVEGVGQALAELGRALLVLDNVEQLPWALSDRVDTWVGAAPSLRILITSRRPLGAPAEERFDVLPLPVLPPGEVLASDAWHLFASGAPPGALTGASAAQAHALLTALDGLPLALRLAAGRLEVLGLDALIDRLAHGYAIVSDPAQPGARHGSLFNAIAWGWSLLSSSERAALSQASVFRGPFGVAAAEAVLDLDGADVLDVMQLLVRRHLLVREGARFRLFEGVRAYADQELIGEARTGALNRHADWLLRWGGVRVARVDSAWLEAGSERVPELLAVVHRAERSTVDAVRGVRCGAAVVRVLYCRGRYPDVRDLADRALALPHNHADAALDALGDLHLARGEARRRTGDVAAARLDLERALQLADRTESRNLQGYALTSLGFLLAEEGLLDEAEAPLRAALHLAGDLGEQQLAARVGSELATLIAQRAGFPGPGDPVHDEAVAMSRHAVAQVAGVDLCAELEVRKSAGWLAIELMDLTSAEEHYGRAAELAHMVDDRRAVGVIDGQLGLVAELRDRPDQAVDRHRRAVAALDAHQSARTAALYSGFLGRALARTGRWEEGLEALDQALSRRDLGGDPRLWAVLETTRALVQARRGATGSREPAGVDEEGAWAVPLVRRGFAAARRGDRATALECLVALQARGPQMSATAQRLLVRDLASQLHELANSWRAAADGAWIAPPGADPIDLSRSTANARILAHLVARRHAHPGAGADVAALFEAGWPGQVAVPRSASNRVRVALSALRKAGIADLVLRGEDGWYLDPSVPLCVER